MSAKLGSVVLDCPEPAALAGFYAQLTGWTTEVVDETWVVLRDGGGVNLCFQQVAEYVPPRWPDPAAPQQFHLDFTVADLDAAENTALALGATELDAPRSRGYRVYADPAGHPFCLCAE